MVLVRRARSPARIPPSRLAAPSSESHPRRLRASPSHLTVPRGKDVVLGVPSYCSLGFPRPGPDVAFDSSERAFGAPGAGGSFASADPEAHLGYPYVMNKMGFRLMDDPRERALRDAIYRAIEEIEYGVHPEGTADAAALVAF